MLYQKAQKKFRAPGGNRTHDPLSSSSDALTIELLEAPVTDPGEGPLLFLEQIEAPRAEKKFFETAPPSLFGGLDLPLCSMASRVLKRVVEAK